MDVTISTPTADDFDAISDVDARNFGFLPTEADIEVWRKMLDLDRFRIARAADGEVVGVAGSFGLELTMPGGARVPMSGVTWVSVSVTHRRQGVLNKLMAEIHVDASNRNEPLLGLGASEGGIYERYGYGVATRHRVVGIDRRRAEFRDGLPPAAGSIRLVDPKKSTAELQERWDRFCVGQPGEIGRLDGWFDAMAVFDEKEARFGALHDDGFAIWTIKQEWDDGHPKHKLSVDDFVAGTPQAHADLWKTILSIDLIGEVRSVKAVAPDDPLPYLLTDPRIVRTTDNNDALWLCPVDIERTFGARSYRVDDDLVVSIEGATYRIGASGVSTTDAAADLETNRAGAGSLLLGAVSASELAAGGRLVAADPTLLGRADALFGWDPKPHLRTMF